MCYKKVWCLYKQFMQHYLGLSSDQIAGHVVQSIHIVLVIHCTVVSTLNTVEVL